MVAGNRKGLSKSRHVTEPDANASYEATPTPTSSVFHFFRMRNASSREMRMAGFSHVFQSKEVAGAVLDWLEWQSEK
jgi:hypothetical protein